MNQRQDHRHSAVWIILLSHGSYTGCNLVGEICHRSCVHYIVLKVTWHSEYWKRKKKKEKLKLKQFQSNICVCDFTFSLCRPVSKLDSFSSCYVKNGDIFKMTPSSEGEEHVSRSVPCGEGQCPGGGWSSVCGPKIGVRIWNSGHNSPLLK